jgi:hypothetical protein
MTHDKVERKYFLARSDINRINAWDTAEKLKVNAFGKLKLFDKPAPEVIICTDFKKYFEPYLMINGIKKVRRKDLIERSTVEQLSSVKEFFEEEVTLVLDKKGRIIKNLLFRDVTELNKTYYEEHRDEFLQLEIPFENGIKIFKKHFLGKDDKAIGHSQGLFVRKVNVVFVSVYLVRYEWKKIGESKIIRIDGYTGKSDLYNT